MNIVLNEIEYAEQAIKEKSLGKHPVQTLTRLARYYLYLGKSATETRRLLEEYALECEPSISVVLWDNKFSNAMKNAIKSPIIVIPFIPVSSTEIKRIKAIKNIQAQRLAFVLLCISKYNHIVNNKNEYWVTTPDNEIMRMANINTSIKRQCALFTILRDAGMIRFSKNIESLSVQVMFCDDGETELSITDFRNLGYQYLKHVGGNKEYLVCESCGLTFKANQSSKGGRPRKYCDACASKIAIERRINRRQLKDSLAAG